jgi:protein-S-isoprenylcysteine O-methyltransferase Ste14
MVAFLGAVVAFPSLVTAVVGVLNSALFVCMAIVDERVLLRSGLAGDYEAYRKRVGMFMPRLGPPRSATPPADSGSYRP